MPPKRKLKRSGVLGARDVSSEGVGASPAGFLLRTFDMLSGLSKKAPSASVALLCNSAGRWRHLWELGIGTKVSVCSTVLLRRSGCARRSRGGSHGGGRRVRYKGNFKDLLRCSMRCLKERHSGFLIRGLSIGEFLWVPECFSFFSAGCGCRLLQQHSLGVPLPQNFRDGSGGDRRAERILL